jgi:hypothetical protein
MIKQISLIAIVAIGIAAVLIGTSHAPAFATVPGGCTGDPHGEGVNPGTGNPHGEGVNPGTGNPHIGDTGNPHNGCPGAK